MTRYYIATMEVFGEEGRKKVERHKKLRQGKGFITIESPKDVGREKVLEMLRPDGQKKPFYWSVFLISQPMKCLVVPLKKDQNLADVQKHWQKKSALTSKRSIKQLAFFAVITNEVGSDGEMYEKETLEYIRLLGLVNCRLAKMASEVVEVVYGIPVKCPH